MLHIVHHNYTIHLLLPSFYCHSTMIIVFYYILPICIFLTRSTGRTILCSIALTCIYIHIENICKAEPYVCAITSANFVYHLLYWSIIPYINLPYILHASLQSVIWLSTISRFGTIFSR